MNVKLKYKLHSKIKSNDRIYEVIGFEWVAERGVKYILLHVQDGDAKWIYLYNFEIKAII